MQQTKPEMMYSFSHWCDRPHNDKSILKYNNETMVPQYILGNETYAKLMAAKEAQKTARKLSTSYLDQMGGRELQAMNSTNTTSN